MMTRNRRIAFIGLNAAGYLSRLHSLASKDYLSRYVPFSSSTYSYDSFIQISQLAAVNRYLTDLYIQRHKLYVLLPLLVVRLGLLVELLFNCDVFVYTGYQGLLNFYELLFLRLCKKHIIVFFLGSDSRPPFLSGKYLDDNSSAFISSQVVAETKSIFKRVKLIERWANYIVTNKASSQFFEKTCVCLWSFGFPLPQIDQSLLIPHGSVNDAKKPHVKIVHPPTRTLAKGTSIFVEYFQCYNKYSGRKPAVIDIIASPIPNKELLQLIASYDFVLDELYSDMPLATLGVESVLLGAIPITGGYLHNYIPILYDADVIPPTPYIDPEDLASISYLINLSTDDRAEIVNASKAFLKKRFSNPTLLRNFEGLLNSNIDPSFMFNPLDISYPYGWGLSSERLFNNLNQLYAEYGFSIFCIDHNRKLVQDIRLILHLL